VVRSSTYCAYVKKGAKDGGKQWLMSNRPASGTRPWGRIMPDTNSACRIALRSNSEIVRYPIGTLYGITRECCAP